MLLLWQARPHRSGMHVEDLKNKNMELEDEENGAEHASNEMEISYFILTSTREEETRESKRIERETRNRNWLIW